MRAALVAPTPQMAGGPEGGISSDVLCGAEGVGALQTAERSIMDRLSQRLGGGILLQGNSQRDAAALRSELCQGGPAFVVEPHAITYSGCRFTMDQQSILMDMRMPEMNGYEATETLKADAALKHIPVIAVTASSFREEEARARSGGIPFSRAVPPCEVTRSPFPRQPDPCREKF